MTHRGGSSVDMAPSGDSSVETTQDGASPLEVKTVIRDLRSMLTPQGLKRAGLLTWGVITCVVAYSTFAFVVYLPALRDKFGMSQSQVEFAMSLTWLGMGSPIVLGPLVNRTGPRVGAAVAMVISTGAYLLLYGACLSVTWYAEHVYLIALYCFLGGAGSGATSIAAISATMSNFTDSYRGTIMMFLTSGTALGGLIFKAIYNDIFIGDDMIPPELQDLGIYFLLIALVFLFVNMGGIVFYGTYLVKELPPDENSHLIDSDSDTSPHDKTNREDSLGSNSSQVSNTGYYVDRAKKHDSSSFRPHNHSLTFVQTLMHPFYHFLAWPCIITQGLFTMTCANSVLFLESFDLLDYQKSLPYTIDIAQMISRPLVAFSSDIVVHRVNRAWFILVGLIINVFVFITDIFLLNNVVVLFLNVIILGYACVATFTMTPSLICDEFGVDAFPRNWGVIQGGNCVAMFGFCNLISAFYSMYSSPVTGHCNDLICYSSTYTIASICAVGAVLMTAMYLYRKRNKWTR